MKQLFLILILGCAAGAHAQTQFYSTVKIEYEKTMSVHAYYKELIDNDEWFNMFKEQAPKTTTNYYD